jgi:hypothetical protein
MILVYLLKQTIMNIKLILQLSAFGLIMSLGTIALIPQQIEPAFWLVIFVFCAYVIAKAAPGKYFLHGFLVSLVNCMWIIAAHAIFYDTYIANHPSVGLMNSDAPVSMASHPRLIQAIFGALIGVISGVVLGLFSVIASKFVKKA